MARRRKGHIKKRNRVILRREVYDPVDRARQERVDNRLLVNTFLNKPAGICIRLS